MGLLHRSHRLIMFAEYGHVEYQIKENKAFNNMLANSLPLHTRFVLWGVKRSFFCESSHVACQIKQK